MKTNRLKPGVLTLNAADVGSVTRKKVLGRAEEAAIIKGEWLHKVSASDFAQARRE